MPRPALLIALLLPLALLAGCPFGSSEAGAEAAAARKEAEGKAIGGACRHAGRAIEDCFGLNKRADKAALFAGWREMNDYMRENKIEPVPPQGAAPTDIAAKSDEAPHEEAAARPAAKPPAKAKKHDS